MDILLLSTYLIWYNISMANQLWLTLIGIAVVVTAGFVISLIIELKKTLRSLNGLLKTTEESLKPTLEELQQTLKSLKNISDNINDVTADMKTLSGSVRDVGLNIKRVSGIVEDITSSVAVKASGVKAGLKTGFLVLLNNLFLKKGGS
jgi:uncharacterized protein YoxC